jgi:hypothetical protein
LLWFRYGFRSYVNETSYRSKAAIASDYSKVGADEVRRGGIFGASGVTLKRSLPLKPQTIIVRIGFALQANNIGVELLLNGSNHGADFVMAPTTSYGVDVESAVSVGFATNSRRLPATISFQVAM